MTIKNTTPPWRSFQQTGNPSDIVSSPTVADAIGQKIDAIMGTASSLTIHDSFFVTGDVEGVPVTLDNIGSASNRVGVAFGKSDGWLLGRDLPAAGSDDLFFYHRTTGQTPFRITYDDQIFVFTPLDKQVKSNAFASIGVNTLLNQDIGQNNPVIGSTGVLWINQNIYDVGTPNDGTFSEFSAQYTMVSPMDGQKVLGPHHVIGFDNHAYSQWTDNPQNRSGMLFGMSELVRPMGANDFVIDGVGSGAFAYAGANTPPSQGEVDYYKGAPSARSYPLTAVFSAAGVSGTPDIYDGNQPGADYGALYGLRVGGGGGTPYLHTDARSKFQKAVGAYDWTDCGVFVGNPLTSSNNQYPPGMVICAQNSGANKYAGLILGQNPSDGSGGYLIVQDTARNGTGDLGIYNRSTGVIAFRLGPTGGVSFNGAPVVAPPQLPAPLPDNATAAQQLTTIRALQNALVSLGLCTQLS